VTSKVTATTLARKRRLTPQDATHGGNYTREEGVIIVRAWRDSSFRNGGDTVDSIATEICDVESGFRRSCDATEVLTERATALTLISADMEIGQACFRVSRSARETLLCLAKILVQTDINLRRGVSDIDTSVWIFTSADECTSSWRLVL